MFMGMQRDGDGEREIKLREGGRESWKVGRMEMKKAGR